MHTSTVTVAVLDPDAGAEFQLDYSEIEIRTTRGYGPGGQHRNKAESCVVATHLPSGIRARADMKSQYQSRMMALSILTTRLAEQAQDAHRRQRQSRCRRQLGTGMRAVKIRTYRQQDSKVTDHRSGKT